MNTKQRSTDADVSNLFVDFSLFKHQADIEQQFIWSRVHLMNVKANLCSTLDAYMDKDRASIAGNQCNWPSCFH